VRLHDGRPGGPLGEPLRVDSLAVVVGGGFLLLATVIHLGFQKLAQVATCTDGTIDRSSHGRIATPVQAKPSLDSALMARDRDIRINEQAQDALSAQRPQYSAICWHPKPPAPGSLPDLGVALAVTLSFDADGHETGREIASAGGPANPTILACARALSLPRLSVPTQGKAAVTEVGLTIP
jgi:hypothetical protein